MEQSTRGILRNVRSMALIILLAGASFFIANEADKIEPQKRKEVPKISALEKNIRDHVSPEIHDGKITRNYLFSSSNQSWNFSAEQYVEEAKTFQHQDSIERYGRGFSKNSDIKPISEEIVSGRTTENAKLGAIFDFVSRNIIYQSDDEISYLPQKLRGAEVPKTPVQTLVDKVGDCDDYSILAHKILYDAGINAGLVGLGLSNETQDGHMILAVEIPYEKRHELKWRSWNDRTNALLFDLLDGKSEKYRELNTIVSIEDKHYRLLEPQGSFSRREGYVDLKERGVDWVYFPQKTDGKKIYRKGEFKDKTW